MRKFHIVAIIEIPKINPHNLHCCGDYFLVKLVKLVKSLVRFYFLVKSDFVVKSDFRK